MAPLSHEYVRWLDVTMNDVLGVRGVQRIGNLNRERHEHLKFKRPPGNLVLERHTIQKLHRDEGLPLLFAYVVNCADIGMIKRRRSLSLALEACQNLWISGDLIGQELKSNIPMQPHVLGLIDHTHPSPAEFFEDAVVRDCLADHST